MEKRKVYIFPLVVIVILGAGLIPSLTAVPVETITLNHPNGGQSWEAEYQYPIWWSSPDWTGNVKLELSTDGGLTFPHLIVASYSGSPPYWWTVTNTPSTTCRIRVSDAVDGTPSDMSDNNFTITSNPTITVDVPDSGESWEADEPRIIVWHTHIFTGNVDIDLSTDGGTSWTSIATNVPTPTSDSATTYTWNVSNTPSTTCRIRVSDAVDGIPSDTSDADFTITSNPTITVDAPNGGENLGINWPWPIVWHSHIFTGNVDIDLSTDGGTNWTSVATNIPSPTTGTAIQYWWTVPNTPSNQCLIRISNSAGGGPTDMSDNNFTIFAYDFGDAPDPLVGTAGKYPTLLANNGARHYMPSDLYLGTTVDGDLDGQDTPNADGDDNDVDGDDEDGVVFVSGLEPGCSVIFQVSVTSPDTAYLNAWIDFNSDGDWDDADEHVIDDDTVTTGVRPYTIDIPAMASVGSTFARFRLSTTVALDPTGEASDGEVEDYQVTIYSEPPTMEAIVEPEGQCYNKAPTFANFGFDDNGALDDVWYQMDSYAVTWTVLDSDVRDSSWDNDGWAIPGFDTLSEGSHTIYFKASDCAGNVVGQSGEWSWQFNKDATSPTVPVLIAPANGAVLTDRTPTFTWHKSTDDGCDVRWYEIMYADNPEFSGPSKVVKYLTDTTHTPSSDITEDIIYWVVKAIDNAGNHSFWSDKWHFTYDSEAPLSPTLVSPIGGIWLDNTSVDFEWTAVTRKGPGTPVHYIFQIDDNSLFSSPFTDTTNATSYNLTLAEGFYYCRVRAYDDAGNQGSFSSTESFGVDITRPSRPTLVAPPDSALQNTPAFVFIWNAATDNPSGVDHYVLEYANNRVFWKATSVNVTDTVYVTGTLADSTYWWHVRAVDRAGNESPWSVRRCATIDTKAPTVPALISPSDSSYINTITPTFVWEAATSTYCLQVGLDATFDTLLVVDTCGLADTFYTVTDSLLFDTLTYHWRVEAIDDAGNHSGYQVHPFIFTIDTIPPHIPTLLLPPDSSFTNDNTPTFVWSLVDLDTLITYCLQVATDTLFDSVSIVIDACDLTDTVYTVSDTLADSIYYWRAEAVDRAGNHSGYPTPFMLTVDTQAPIFTDTTVWDDTSFTGPYPVSSIINDALSGVDSAFLYYSFDAGTTWSNIVMQLTPPDTYEADIPQVPDSNTVVQYYLEASDLASNIGYDPAGAPDSFYSFVGGATTDEKLGTEEQVMIPTEFALSQNHPNPFISNTSIKFALPRELQVSLKIYDMSGRLVETLFNDELEAGYHTVNWNPKELLQGIYFYKIRVHTDLETGDYTETRKMILLR